MDWSRSSLLTALVFSLLLAHSSALVPIIGWSNSDAFSSVSGNQFESADEFLYNADMDKCQMIIVFKSPELSFDSLAKYGGAYSGNTGLVSLQSELEMAQSSVWAGAEGTVSSDLISTLSFLQEADPVDITGDKGLKSVHKLIVVHLQTSSDEEGLIKQDEIIGNVMARVEALPGSPKYAAIYSADHTYKPHPQTPETEHHQVRRSVNERVLEYTAAGENSGNSLCASVSENGQICVLFCLSSDKVYKTNGTLYYQDKGNNPDVEYLTDIVFGGGACGNSTGDCEEYGGACVTLNANLNETEIEMAFVFLRGDCNNGGNPSVRCGFWTIELYIDGEKFLRLREETFIFQDFLIPLSSSYACGENKLNIYVPPNATKINAHLNSDIFEAYHFEGIQVQAFGGIQKDQTTNGPVFGSAYNCQGYLTTVPLMGLVAVIILIIILYCSVVFMFSLKTLDRFDDPRGPTITVENLH